MSSKVIRIFLKDGEAKGLRFAEISGRTVHASIFPRQKSKEFFQFKDKNTGVIYSQRPGVYILLGSEDDKNKIYIGEGDPVLPRLQSHSRNKDFWNEAIVITSTSSDLGKTQIQYIESELIDIAKKTQGVELDNGNSPAKPNISYYDEKSVNDFIEDIKVLLSALGVDIFNSMEKQNKNIINCNEEVYEIHKKNVAARMKIVDYKYVILKGSTAVKECVASASKGLIARRESLISEGIMKLNKDGYYIFEKDYRVDSPSTASDVILGSSTNGRIEWKYGEKTLKEIDDKNM